mmetsp:Transcript_12565/g.24567  ORF Transcript_12565/g.24567 Transcript_12565/m.24567 type:complete len:760 (-) Transcript_12565:67-2346(-)
MQCLRVAVLLPVLAGSFRVQDERDLPFRVNIPDVGSVRGRRSSHFDAIQFMSIPFAIPPEGEYMLMPPVPFPVPWQTEYGTTEWPKPCTQFKAMKQPTGWVGEFLGRDADKFFEPGQRDCLYLDIFVPARHFTMDVLQKLPIMFFIYGGSFQSGDSAGYGIYDGSSLAANQNVIVVTSNYRLGPEGFLAHPSMLAAGGQYNLGLLDQRTAMQWVSHHISAFGGDADRVTLFGESAGAMSICFHLTSPQSFPYFHGAILQSAGCEGSSIWMEKSRAEVFATAVAASIGCTSNPLQDPGDLDCLRNSLSVYRPLSFDEWIEKTSPLGQVPDEGLALTPIIDMADGGLTKMPNELIEEGAFHKVPIIVGTNRDEGTLFKSLNPIKGRGAETFTDLVYHILGPELLPGAYETYGPVKRTSQLKKAIANFLGDGLFVCPTHNFVHAVAKHSEDIYFYRFVQGISLGRLLEQGVEFLSKLISNAKNRYDLLVGLVLGALGVPHTLDLFFVFNTNENKEGRFLKFGETEKLVAKVFQSYWGQFAHTGSPNGPLTVSFLPEWKPFGNKELVMRLRGSPTMEPVRNDVEADIERRCSWWASNPSALRARSKPWQLAPSSVNLGLRCCCDHDHEPSRCIRATSTKVEELTHKAGSTGRTNWLGLCPRVDFGLGKVQTHHDPLGCTLKPPETSFGRCCCVNRKKLPWFAPGGAVHVTAKPDYLCNLISNEQELKGRTFCPEVCVVPPNTTADDESCIYLQSHHMPGACKS